MSAQAKFPEFLYLKSHFKHLETYGQVSGLSRLETSRHAADKPSFLDTLSAGVGVYVADELKKSMIPWYLLNVFSSSTPLLKKSMRDFMKSIWSEISGSNIQRIH